MLTWLVSSFSTNEIKMFKQFQFFSSVPLGIFWIFFLFYGWGRGMTPWRCLWTVSIDTCVRKTVAKLNTLTLQTTLLSRSDPLDQTVLYLTSVLSSCYKGSFLSRFWMRLMMMQLFFRPVIFPCLHMNNFRHWIWIFGADFKTKLFGLWRQIYTVLIPFHPVPIKFFLHNFWISIISGYNLVTSRDVVSVSNTVWQYEYIFNGQ